MRASRTTVHELRNEPPQRDANSSHARADRARPSADKLNADHAGGLIGLPYWNPGDDVRLWQRRQGTVFFEVQAVRILKLSLDTTVEPVVHVCSSAALMNPHTLLRNGKGLERQTSATINCYNQLTHYPLVLAAKPPRRSPPPSRSCVEAIFNTIGR